MSNLTDASRELFKRQPDECFPSLTALWEHCQRQKEVCVDRWVPPRSIQTNPVDTGRLMLASFTRNGPNSCESGYKSMPTPFG